MSREYELIHQRKKLGTIFLKEEPAEPKKEIKAESMQPLKKDFRIVRKRRKIGEKLIEEQFEEQKVRIKEQINELPKELRKAFVKELQESI